MKDKRIFAPLVLAALVILVIGLFSFFNLFASWEQKFYDLQMFLQGEQDFRDDLVIVGITEDDLATLGQFPWPRDYHAKLIEILSKSEAAAIGLDIIFAEPSLNRILDQQLVEAASKSGKVVTAVYGKLEDSCRIGGNLSTANLIKPFPALAAVTRPGVINIIPDSDGIVRKTILLVRGNNDFFPSFELELLKLKGFQVEQTSQGQLKLNGKVIPTDPWQRILVNFIGPAGTFPVIAYQDVLAGNFPDHYFQDKIVLVGATTVGLHDYYFIPFSHQPMYGIEFHANALQTILNYNYKLPLPWITNLGIIVFTTLFLALLFQYFSFWKGLVVLSIFSLAFFLISCFLFEFYNVYLEAIPPLIAAFLIYLLTLIHNFIQEQKEKRRVTQLFGRYVEASVVEKLLAATEEDIQLGGVRQEITVLFMDIRGFTTLSENLTSEEVVKILNSFLDIVVEVVFQKEGTLDKFIGDAAMVIYNAPLPVANHALRAVETAEAIMDRIETLQEKLLEVYGRTIEFGFGINTGEAIVGNVGSKQRMEYTAIGDAVNLAARLESVAEPREILISPEVYKRVKEYYYVDNLGQKEIKGKSQPLEIYKIRGKKEEK